MFCKKCISYAKIILYPAGLDFNAQFFAEKHEFANFIYSERGGSEKKLRDPKNGNNNLLCNVLSDTPCNSIAIFSWKLTLTQIDVSRNRLAKKREMHTTFAPRVWDQVQVRGQSTNYPADLKTWAKFNKVFIKLRLCKENKYK